MMVLNDMTADARVSREAKTLADAGHEVTVLALASKELPHAEPADGYEIRRVAEFTSAGIADPARKITQQRQRTRAFRDAAVALNPAVVHAHDTPALPAAYHAAAEAGAALVYDAHELYPDSLEQRPIQGAWPVRAYWRRVEARYATHASAVLTVSDGLREVLRQRYGVEAVVVANAPDLQPIADRGALRRRLRVSEDTVIVLYQGRLAADRALEALVDAVTPLHNATLVVQGSGAAISAMHERAVSNGVADRVVFMGQVPWKQLFTATCGADIGTCFLDGVTLNHQLAWPNRLFMYFMAGIPSVVSSLPGMDALVQHGRLGLTVPPGDVPKMTAALKRLAGDESLRTQMGERARRAAESRFNWETASRGLLDAYARLERRA